MKVLFLDVDGVLNSSRSTMARTGVRPSQALETLRAEYSNEDDELPYGPQFTFETIDPVAVDLVNRLLKKSGANLVISSSHRSMFLEGTSYGSDAHMRVLKLYFKALGIEFPIFDITPKLYVDRGIEVSRWLEDRENVTHYVILDDGRDFRPSQHLVWCDPHVGFSHENYFDACKHLDVQESTIIY